MKSVVITALLLSACSERPLPLGSGDAASDGGTFFPGPIGSTAWPGTRYVDPKGQFPELASVWGSGPDDVYLGNYSGTPLHSSDRGVSWQILPHPELHLGFSGTEEGDWPGVWGSGPDDVFAVGGCEICLLHSNGDRQWTQMAAPPFKAASTDVWGSGSDDVYSTGFGTLIHYDETGSWQEDPNTDPLFGITAYGIWGSDHDHVFTVTDDGRIARGSGLRWQITPSSVTTGLWDVWGSGLNDIYVVGDGGVILHSSDGGDLWARQQSGTDLGLHAVWGSSATEVYIVGAKGVILRSADHGASWAPEDTGVQDDLWGIWGSSANDIYVVGDHGTILHRQSQ